MNGSKISSSSADTDDSKAGETTSTSKGKQKGKESFTGPDYTPDGIPVGPHGTERAIAEEEEGNENESEYNSENEGDIHMNGHSTYDDEDYEHTNTNEEEELPSKDIFGARDGIKHFTASAKTGENVNEIFDYLVKRINARWKWQDELDANQENGFGSGTNGRIGNVRTGGPNDSIQVGTKLGNNEQQKGWRSACC